MWNQYRQREHYFAATPFDPIVNSVKSDSDSVTTFLTKMKTHAEEMHRVMAAPNEVYKRALRRLRDGHVDIESFSTMQAKRHDNGDVIEVFTAQVAASLRYMVILLYIRCM